MTLDPATPRSRRAILAAAAGAAAATVVGAVTKPTAVRAAGDDGTAITIGGTYGDARSQTTLANDTSNENVLWVASNDDGFGNNSGYGTAITGFSAHGAAIDAQSNGTYSVHGHGTAIGVFGETSASNSYGVLGYNTGGGSGTAIRGWTTGTTGVEGFAGSGTGTTRGVWGYAASVDGIGVSGEVSAGSGSTFGVKGISSSTTGIGAAGHAGSGTGIFGYSGPAPFPAAKAKTGVYGYANQNNSAKGVFGQSSKGWAGYFAGRVYTSKYHEMKEVSTPAAPGANKARLFVRDNGSGKTQLCVRFNTGGVLVIKTQP